MKDHITKALEGLQGKLPEARRELSDTQKDDLVARVGPRTVRDIVKAKSDLPLVRIPFVFSRVDTQDMVDILSNEMGEAIARGLARSLKRA